MGTIGGIVLATDGSADAHQAMRAAVDIAHATDAAVHVVNAWSLEPSTYGNAYAVRDELYERYAAEAGAVVDADRSAIADGGIADVTGHVQCGRPSDVILTLSDRVGAGLVVVGSRGRGPLARLALGSVSDSLVREAQVPVLVVRHGEHAWPPERVVAGYDGSPEAVSAARLGTLLATCVGVPITVLEVVPVLSEGDLAMPGSPVDVVAARRAELESRIGGVLGSAARGADLRVEIGHPAALLVAAAEGPRPALLAVGRRGAGRIRHMLLGSVSTKLLHVAPGAVLVVPHR